MNIKHEIDEDGVITFTVKACPEDLQFVGHLRQWALNVVAVLVDVIAKEIDLRGAR